MKKPVAKDSAKSKVKTMVSSKRPVRNPRLNPCETEDSDNCYWDGKTRGNGKGKSFIVINGKVTYEPVKAKTAKKKKS